jgi:hypothetical protein
MTNPLRCLGEMLATFVGRALGGAFFLLGKARGKKALHPRGEVLQGLIGRHGAVGRTGVPWLDEAGTDHVAVRLSRSLGCPLPAQTSWVWRCASPRNLASSVMCFWRRPEQDPSADMCCCRHAGMVCAPTHRCFSLQDPGWPPPAGSDSDRGPPATVQAGLRQADGTVAVIRDTGGNADDTPW